MACSTELHDRPGSDVNRPALARVRKPFRALVCAFVPEARALSPAEWRQGEALVDRMLASRPRAVRRQVAWLVRALDLLAIASRGRRLSALSPPAVTRLLESLQNSPVLLVRRGIWGLRTLAFLAYYGRPEGRRTIGYRADPAGWTARRNAGEGSRGASP
jgi:hypothetical protein